MPCIIKCKISSVYDVVNVKKQIKLKVEEIQRDRQKIENLTKIPFLSEVIKNITILHFMVILIFISHFRNRHRLYVHVHFIHDNVLVPQKFEPETRDFR